jgi:ketosteroid isomerase-like protein
MSTPPARAPRATTPHAVIEAFSERVSAGDLEGALALYEPGAAFRPTPEGPPVHGGEAIRRALEAFLALSPTLTGHIERVLEADGLALVVNRWELRGAGANGEAVVMSGRSVDVLRRRADGEWRIALDDPWGGTTRSPAGGGARRRPAGS